MADVFKKRQLSMMQPNSAKLPYLAQKTCNTHTLDLTTVVPYQGEVEALGKQIWQWCS